MASRTRDRSTVDDDLLRERICLYLRVLFLIHLGFTVMTIVQEALGGGPISASPKPLRLQVVESVLIGALGAGWWYFHRGRPPRWALYASDVAVPLVLAVLYVRLMVLQEAMDAGLIILVLVSLALVLRAALVPSPVGRTTLVGILGEASAVVGSVVITPELQLADHLWVAVLGAAFVTVTAVTSKVIYGLRHEVRAAKRLGQYELVRKLGEGGMGVVYEATHVLLRRPTAVKLLPVGKAGQEAVARFEREVRHTSRLEHPNSVSIYDYGRTPDGEFYYAMEYIDGIDLERLIRDDGPVNDARATQILRQAARALAEAHEKGLVHRDVKPANIMVCCRGGVPDLVKVLDFGLVKSMHADAAAADGATLAVTQATTVIGTPHYLAPETIRGAGPVGPAADIYALGAVGYYLLTGRVMFDGTSAMEVCSRHLTEMPRPPSEIAGRDVDRTLEPIVLRCLAKDPGERYTDGHALHAALASVTATGWSESQARDWWAARDGGTAPPVSSPSTARTQLAVDVQGRRAPGP